ncbi:MAG: SDR family NAD(P)-dependent oxidoreductase [Thermodesulforhabdaceae bacterium]
MEKMLDGRICLITGAGRGIGRATALLFASEGARLVLSDLDREPLEEVMTQIKNQGGEVVGITGDVTADDFAERFVKTSVEAFGPDIHVIVNNAGYTWDGVVHKMADEQWEAMLKVHCTAPFRIIRAAAPYIRENAKKEKAEGRVVMRKIVNVTSIAGTDGNAGQANYSTAKAGIIGFTKTLAKEWGQLNVNVNAVAFGWIETRLTQPKKEDTVLEKNGKKIPIGVPKEHLDVFRLMIPLGRPGTPDEAARVILFLASPLSDYVSGQVIKVTGGW